MADPTNHERMMGHLRNGVSALATHATTTIAKSQDYLERVAAESQTTTDNGGSNDGNN